MEIRSDRTMGACMEWAVCDESEGQPDDPGAQRQPGPGCFSCLTKNVGRFLWPDYLFLFFFS